MHTQTARGLTVVVLLSLAGLTGMAVSRTPASEARPPAAAGLLSGTEWRILEAFAPGKSAFSYQQWRVARNGGEVATLFVGATNRPQAVFPWSGELGYLGEGYVVGRLARQRIEVGTVRGEASVVQVDRSADSLTLAYAVVRPDGIVAKGDEALPGLALDSLQRRGPYYLVRVSVAGAGDASRGVAEDLLHDVLVGLHQGTGR